MEPGGVLSVCVALAEFESDFTVTCSFYSFEGELMMSCQYYLVTSYGICEHAVKVGVCCLNADRLFTVNLTVCLKSSVLVTYREQPVILSCTSKVAVGCRKVSFTGLESVLSVPLCSSSLPHLRGCFSVSHLCLTRLQPPSHSHKLFLSSPPGHFVLIRVYMYIMSFRPGLKKHHLNICLRFGLLQGSFINLVLTLPLYSIIYYCLDRHFKLALLCIQHTYIQHFFLSCNL